MSRRTRKPGPIKEGPTAPGTRLPPPGFSPWMSVNPVPGGVLPTDVDTLTSDDIDNGTLGVWYYYDPNDTLDISGHASDWLIQTTTGVEFYADLSKVDAAAGGKLEYDHNTSQGGRVSTALLKPDGSGHLTFGDLVGGCVEFLVEAGEACPHNENQKVGLFVGISDHTVMSVTSGRDTYGLMGCYNGAASTTAVDGESWNPNASQAVISDAVYKHYASFHFFLKDDDEVSAGYHLQFGFDADGEYNSVKYYKNQGGHNIAPGDKVYLTVGVAASADTGSGSAVKRTGTWKLYYRLTWNKEVISPTYVMGGNNQNSGFSSGYFDS